MVEKDSELTLKEMCEKFQVTPRTLRYYEYIELLSPRHEGRSRFYGPRERGRLKLILRGKKFGFSLEETRQWLNIYDEPDGSKKQLETWVDIATSQIGELQNRITQIQEAISELNELRDYAMGEIAKKST